jgi:serine protease Do
MLQLDGESVGGLVRWFAHDAAIYGGNSGGPLVNLKGEIIGVNEISFGLSGAIPGNLARAVAEELMRTGKVRRSWVGFDVQPLFKKGSADRGVVIGGVLPGSPAAAAGLKSGDILVELAGKPVQVQFDEQMPEFMKLTTTLPIGEEVTAVVLRDGQRHVLKLRAVERGEIFPKQQEFKPWGLTGRDLSFLAALEMKRPNTNGVLITSIRAGGPSGDAKPPL